MEVCLWLQCSASCGEGQRSRTVRCVVRKRRVVDSELCFSQGLRQPVAVERCHAKHCARFHWMTSSWSQVRRLLSMYEAWKRLFEYQQHQNVQFDVCSLRNIGVGNSGLITERNSRNPHVHDTGWTDEHENR